jgi:hypothetical protein
MKRPVNELESHIIIRVADRLQEPKRSQLLDDLTHAEAESFPSEQADRVVFYISGYERPPYLGQESFVWGGGEMKDKDGAMVGWDVYEDQNGRLLELELIRYAPGKLIAPDWRTLMFF